MTNGEKFAPGTETGIGLRLSHQIARRLENLNVEVFVFGISENDVDLAVLTDDDVSPLFVVEALSGTLLDLSIQEGRLVTCTPIKRSKFARADTAFVKNVISARAEYA
ncbi:hypothetical protein [Rhizobium sp. RU36D]|uniref:hypothetical protein n=1 Tax=Rhizobium sp. RU36D TaxID=1907415 RepID=UPI0009D90487|nr:hypothetical protein [Rhizobium sp. RU36D]SMD19618.1 hypothetical protein SAMN05880593_14225 [Rhizobium sp. RU36D]